MKVYFKNTKSCHHFPNDIFRAEKNNFFSPLLPSTFPYLLRL